MCWVDRSSVAEGSGKLFFSECIWAVRDYVVEISMEHRFCCAKTTGRLYMYAYFFLWTSWKPSLTEIDNH